MKKRIYIMSLLILVACRESPNDAAGKQSEDPNKSPSREIAIIEKIPLSRDSIRSEPVAEFVERTDNNLNEWYFSVKVFETSKTFDYLVKLQYEEVEGTDSLRLPNIGTFPEPVIQKGPEKYSCIIGFKDRDGKFLEYKKVYVKDGNLKITTLKRYAVKTVDN